jgi:hypothetical protein
MMTYIWYRRLRLNSAGTPQGDKEGELLSVYGWMLPAVQEVHQHEEEAVTTEWLRDEAMAVYFWARGAHSRQPIN